MSDNLKLYIETLVDDSALKAFERKKRVYRLDVKLNINTDAVQQNQKEIKKRIDNIKAAMGDVSVKMDASGKITQVIAQYRTEAGIVKEIWKTEKDKNTLKLQNKTITDGILKSEKMLTSEVEKQDKATQRLIDKKENSLNRIEKQLNTFRAKESSYTPGVQLSNAQDIARQMEGIQSGISNMPIGSPERMKGIQDLNALSEKLRVAQIGLKGAGEEALTFGQRMQKAFERIGFYAITAQALYKALAEVQKGIQYIKDLNKEMTDIQIVTGMNKGQISDLSHEYNAMAKEMGATTLEVAKGKILIALVKSL